jgi:hypothetical protein
VPVDLRGATKGRVMISSSTGVVTVQAKNGAFSNAQCFTSLERCAALSRVPAAAVRILACAVAGQRDRRAVIDDLEVGDLERGEIA